MNKSKLDLLREVRQKKVSIEQALKNLQELKKTQSSIATDSFGNRDNSVSVVEKHVAKSDDVKKDWQDYLRDDLLSLVANILKLEQEKIHPDTSVVDLGLDSLSATEFNNLMRSQYKIKISPSIFFECNTVNDFHSYLIDHHSSQMSDYYQKDRFVDSIVEKQKTPNSHSLSPVEISVEQNSPSSSQKKSKSYLEQLWDELERKYDEKNYQLNNQERLKVPIESVISQKTQRLLICPPNELKIEIFIAGRGEPLLLLGGLLNPAEIWSNQLETLTENYQVIIFNQPGCGNSEINPESLTLELIINNMLTVLNTLNLHQPLTIIGYSFGGIIAQLFCLNYPQRVKSLIIACSTPYTNRDKTDLKLLINELTNNKQFKEIVHNVNIKDLLPYDRAAKGFDVLAELEKIEVPTLILAGQEDKYMKPLYSKAIHQAISQSEYQEIEGAGHLLLLTHTQDFNNKVCNFLKSLSSKKNLQLAK